MPGPVVGINRTSLWNSWKSIRQQLHKASVRDVVDFFEYDVEPEVWIRSLLRKIADGSYEPDRSRRFTLAKSKGFNRLMTLPTIPDLVLYGALVEYLYRRIKHRQHKHVYFDVTTLARAQAEVAAAAREQMRGEIGPYGTTRVNRFLAWLHYDQYRRYLILKRVYPFIVTTDITNFFDSVLYSGVAESLHGIASPPRLISLLFFLLERLSVRGDYTESARIGLPVDEFDCSRKLAHILLFPHDGRMVNLIGENAYIRWSDDQNMGVQSRSDGFNLLANVQKSLAILHLTPAGEKSRVLSLSQARRHFHLDINSQLDRADALPCGTGRERKLLRAEITGIWRKARRYEGVGEWDKILKRIYRLAGLAQSRLFRQRAIRDLLQNPDLKQRIADYMRCTGTLPEYVAFVESVWHHNEQIYPDVNVALVESLLRLEPNKREYRTVRKIASDLLSGKLSLPGRSDCAAVAPLLILRVGDRRSLPLLRRCIEDPSEKLEPPVVRAAAVVYASYGIREFRVLRRAAARALTRQLATLVRLIERVLDYKDFPGRYKIRFETRYDAVAGRPFIDMRRLLAIRLLALNDRKAVRSWIAARAGQLQKSKVSGYDKALLARVYRVRVAESRYLS